ncbi:hypothetical protein [Nocardia testacea]|uniref:hypothetical protein n=1 Tax=Nocardia testacea TaxID=248551 RepID=UPI0012F64BC9|nr:hypothetical protein [Nocardia testacea]
MRSSDRIGSPSPWAVPAGFTQKHIAAMLGLTGLVVLCFGIAAAMWRSDDHAARVVSKYVALFGLAMAATVAMGVWANEARKRRSRIVQSAPPHGAAATVVPGSIGYFTLYQTIWSCFAVLFLGAAFEIGAAAWPTHWPLALLLACLGLGSASAPALAVAGRLRRGRVVLTDQEIVHYGWSSRTSLAWADAPRVITAFERQRLIVITGSDGARWSTCATTPIVRLGRNRHQLWKLDRPAAAGSIVLECPRLAVDGYRLYRFLTYYADNPTARVELGTPAATKRWATVL